jgi:hypothetical protein
MRQSILIERLSEDRLSAKRWWFWYHDSDHNLYLTAFATLERSTRRHDFRVKDNYRRIDARGTSLSVDDVEIPDDVRDEAIKQFMDSLTVEKWSK